jgi:predicted MPP superfamily phosphohydrolase
MGATGLGLYTWRVEPHWLEIVRRPLPIRHLPRSLDGRTLVQVSDVHVGTRVDDDYVLSTFRRVGELEPDFVVLTGDFMSYHDSVFDQLAAIFRHFPRGRLGTFAVLGNHDYGPRWSHPEVAQRLVETVAPFGIEVLRNGICEVEGLQIAGLDDWWSGRCRPRSVVERLDRRRAAIVLSHNPDTVDLPGWHGYEGWILSGHTHGGQCKPPFLPAPLLPVRNRRYTAGEFDLSGNRRLYISRGVGHLTQVRFNVRPEVTVFTLQSAIQAGGRPRRFDAGHTLPADRLLITKNEAHEESQRVTRN